MPESGLLEQAIRAARSGRKTEARGLLIKLVEEQPRNETAWVWLSGLVDDLEDKIIACENVLAINPANQQVRAYLDHLLEQQERQPLQPAVISPAPNSIEQGAFAGGLGLLDLAKRYEAEGSLDRALKTYGEAASQAREPREFNRIYNEIMRLEGLQAEQIAHISPAATIARLAFGWPLLYFSLALVQMGLNPLAHGVWYIWLGLPIVTVGSFLLALAQVRSRHAVWRMIFSEQGAEGSSMARTSATIGGWLLVLTPHMLMLADSLVRLQQLGASSYHFGP